MKKNKLNNFLKTGILFFGVSLLLFNCEKEEINFSEKKIIEIIEFNQIDNKITNLIPEVKSKNTQKQKSTSSKENIVFNFKEIVKLIDSLKNTKFTIEFITTNQPENIFYNLVLGENNEGEILDPLIYKYTIDNYYEFKQKLKVGHFKLKGKKEIFNYNSFKNNFNNVNSLAKTNSTPCGGDSTVVEFDSASGGFWWDEYQIKRTYIVFEEDGNFEFPKTSSKSSNDCGGGSPSGSTAAIIDTNKCPTGSIKDIDTDECVEDDQVFNELTDKCAKDTFAELENGIYQDDPIKPEVEILAINTDKLNFSEEILHLFASSKETNYTINNGNLTGKNASTDPLTNTTTLSNLYLNNATELSIARTMIHEQVHAYINSVLKGKPGFKDMDLNTRMREYAKDKGITDAYKFHHEFMGQYVNGIALSLYEWDKNYGTGKGLNYITKPDELLGWDYYKAMAWGGLFQVDTSGNIVKTTDSFKELVKDSKERQKIADIVANENSGNNDSQGTKCN